MHEHSRRRHAVSLPLALILLAVGLIAVRASVSNAAVGDINTVAGTGGGTSSGDNGPASSAGVIPVSMTSDDYGNYYIGERGRVRRVDASTGQIKTLVGDGTYASSGDGGQASAAKIQTPQDLALDSAGNLYIFEGVEPISGSQLPGRAVRKIDANSGVISTILVLDDVLQGGPSAMTVNGAGEVFVAWHFWVFKFSGPNYSANGYTIVAGSGQEGDRGDGGAANGPNVKMSTTGALAVAPNGEIYIGDYGNSKIRKVGTDQKISTFAGAANFFNNQYPVAANSAVVSGPSALALDRAGNLFILEAKKLWITKVSGGQISRVAGDGSDGATNIGDGGPAVLAKFLSPSGLTTTPGGNLLISDGGSSDFSSSGQNRVRAVSGIATGGSPGPMIGYGGDKSAPTVNFGFNPASPTTAQTVTFSDTSSNGPITGWNWNFGDSSSSTVQNPSHTFATAGTYNVQLTVTKWNGATASVTKQVVVSAVTTTSDTTVTIPPGGGNTRYRAMASTRVLDTRTAVGVPTAGKVSQSVVDLDVTTAISAAFPGATAATVDAVVINVTATGPTATSWVTVWPTGSTKPVASNLNMTADQTIPNLVIAKVGTGGKISLANQAGQTHLVGDLMGYFPKTSGYIPLVPARVLDTRSNIGVNGIVGTSAITLDLDNQGGLPASGLGGGAVVLNVTSTGSTASNSWATVWPGDVAQPEASNLNYQDGETIPNLVVAKIAPDGTIKLNNAFGSTHLIADVMGYFPSGATVIQPLTPKRVLDTRTGVGAPAGMVTSAGITLDPRGVGAVPAGATTGSAILNVTTTGASANTWVTVWPTDIAQPETSNLNSAAGDTIPNLVIVKLGSDGKVRLANAVGSTHLVADIVGYMPAT